MSPLVDIFYPGYNVDVPNDMQLGIGIRCSDDYGLEKGTFYHTFEGENTKHLALERGAIEDTIYFQWDLSEIGMLPGDEISYYIEWGDGTNSSWTRLKPSGEPLNTSHIWEQRDSYTIRSKAKDTYGAESDWATLEVSMPKSKSYFNDMVIRFFENHPLLKNLLYSWYHLYSTKYSKY